MSDQLPPDPFVESNPEALKQIARFTAFHRPTRVAWRFRAPASARAGCHVGVRGNRLLGMAGYPSSVDIPPEAGSLTPRYRRTVALAGGLAGAIIGPTGFYLYAVAAVSRLDGSRPRSVGASVDWSSMMSRLGSHRYGWLVIVLAFLATFAMMVPAIRWIEARVERLSGSYYRRAALAGMAVGFVATALLTLTFFVTSMVMGAMRPDAVSGAGDVAAMAAGGVIFGGLAALVVPVLFLPYIALFGIPFGLVLGWAVRRGARPAQDA